MGKIKTPSKRKVFVQDLAQIALCCMIAFAGLAYVLYSLPGLPPIPTCPKPPEPPASIDGILKYGLIATHIFTFVLIPLCMRVFYCGLQNLGASLRAIFSSQLGLSFIMVAIAYEIGWHVIQEWYYINEFNVLNFVFYFFLIAAFALWADGLVHKISLRTKIIDLVFALLLLAVSVLYVIGAAQSNDSFKIPIYVALILVFAILTWRGWQLLKDWRIIFFPILSVGVNLAFIFLLDSKGSCDPITNDPRIVANAIFHMSHDLFGALAGIAFFTWLMYVNAVAPKNSSST